MAEISLLTPADYDRAAGFLAAFPGERRGPAMWKRRFAFWWDENPAFTGAQPRAWLLLAGGTVKGFLGAVPSRFQIGGSAVAALGMTTWRVAADARGASLELLYALAAAGDKDLLVNTTANEDVRRLLRGLRFDERAGCADGRTSLLLARGGPAARAAGLVLNLPFNTKRFFDGAADAIELRSGDPAFGRELDSLWARTRDLSPAATVRDAAFHRWFTYGDPLQKKFLVGLRENGELCATATFCRREWPKKTELELVDFWPASAAAAERQAFAVLLAGKRIADRERCDLFRIPHFSDSLRKACARAGAWLSRSDDRRHFFHGAQLPPEGAVLTGVEGDFSL
jgi:hypothetical protein